MVGSEIEPPFLAASCSAAISDRERLRDMDEDDVEDEKAERKEVEDEDEEAKTWGTEEEDGKEGTVGEGDVVVPVL